MKPLNPLTREEAAEALDNIEKVRNSLGNTPHKDALVILSCVDMLEEALRSMFPGRYFDPCYVCGQPLGNDDIAAYDSENSLSFCEDCAPPKEPVPTPDADGFMPWNGGPAADGMSVPVPEDQMVDAKLRNGEVITHPAWDLYWKHGRPDALLREQEIVGYRLHKPKPDEFPVHPLAGEAAPEAPAPVNTDREQIAKLGEQSDDGARNAVDGSDFDALPSEVNASS